MTLSSWWRGPHFLSGVLFTDDTNTFIGTCTEGLTPFSMEQMANKVLGRLLSPKTLSHLLPVPQIPQRKDLKVQPEVTSKLKCMLLTQKAFSNGSVGGQEWREDREGSKAAAGLSSKDAGGSSWHLRDVSLPFYFYLVTVRYSIPLDSTVLTIEDVVFTSWLKTRISGL